MIFSSRNVLGKGALRNLEMEYLRSCCFTGHREIPLEKYGEIWSAVEREALKLYENGVRTFIVGGALGFDTLAAREVIKFRISHPDARLLLYLPCVNQDEQWSERDRNNYQYVLNASDEILYLYDEYVDGCMKERNLRLAEKADILISYVSRSNSGTGQTVRMAEKLGKEIYNLYPSLDSGRK